MKKLFTFIAVAAIAVACCNKQPVATLTVEKFFENPKALAGQDTTVTGTIQSSCSTGQFVLTTADNNEKMQLLIVPIAENVKFCPGCVGKQVSIKGMINEVIVDTEFITNLENEANADENAETKESKLKKVRQFREIVATEGIFSLYSIAATAAKECGTDCKNTESCCKDGNKAIAKAEGCCKDGNAKCEKACTAKAEGCCKDGNAKCEKACEKACTAKAEGACKNSDAKCEKACEKACEKK